MDRDAFFKRFPWVFPFPEKPLCMECGYESAFYCKDGKVIMTEFHGTDCSREDMVEHEIMEMPSADVCV